MKQIALGLITFFSIPQIIHCAEPSSEETMSDSAAIAMQEWEDFTQQNSQLKLEEDKNMVDAHIVRFEEYRGIEYTVKAFGWQRTAQNNEDWYLFFFDRKNNAAVCGRDEQYEESGSTGPHFLEDTNLFIIYYTSIFEISGLGHDYTTFHVAEGPRRTRHGFSKSKDLFYGTINGYAEVPLHEGNLARYFGTFPDKFALNNRYLVWNLKYQAALSRRGAILINRAGLLRLCNLDRTDSIYLKDLTNDMGVKIKEDFQIKANAKDELWLEP